MKKTLSVMMLFSTFNLLSEPTCALCELHREYNEKHPGDYEYYEDYLKAQKKEDAPKNPSPQKP